MTWRQYVGAIKDCNIVEIHTIIGNLASVLLLVVSLGIATFIGLRQVAMASQANEFQRIVLLEKNRERNREAAQAAADYASEVFALHQMVPSSQGAGCELR